jgi:hypothetical protein
VFQINLGQVRIVPLIIETIAIASGIFAGLASIVLFLRLSWPAPVLWFLKLYTSTPDSASGFDRTFGSYLESVIPTDQKNHFLSSPTIIKLPAVPNGRLEQNVSFAPIPGTCRDLLCDMWQPSDNILCSGLAFIYLHGTAFYFLDKDFGTRPFFNMSFERGVSFFKSEVFKNPYIWCAVFSCILIALLSYWLVPVRNVLAVTIYGWKNWSIVFAFAFLSLGIIQLFKKLRWII